MEEFKGLRVQSKLIHFKVIYPDFLVSFKDKYKLGTNFSATK